MQITSVEVIPVELQRAHPLRMAGLPPLQRVTAIFVRLNTRSGRTAWGCTVAGMDSTGDDPALVLRACQHCAALLPDLHPTNIAYTLTELSQRVHPPDAALCAFDLALHDLLGQAADMPVYRLLGGYRDRIATSVTLSLGGLEETVEAAQRYAARGFRMFKVKGGEDPAEDVRRVRALRGVLPNHTLRLDADGGYSVQDALDVARALAGVLETLEQPVAAADLPGLREVTAAAPLPVLADQSLRGPASALELAAGRIASGLSIKLAACGGLRRGQQIDTIARAAHLGTMVSCYIEPALLTGAGLALALSSPNVRYGDLDGSFDLLDDPSVASFRVEDGQLVAGEAVGLGYHVNLG